jgi:hypothetical protein
MVLTENECGRRDRVQLDQDRVQRYAVNDHSSETLCKLGLKKYVVTFYYLGS